MDFELSEDQQALGDAARALLDGLAGPSQVRAHLASGDRYDAKLWRSMAEQGWLGVAVPETLGGLGLGFVEAAVLLSEAGRHVAPTPFLPTLLALSALVEVPEIPEAAEWAERLAAGRAIGCVAWSRRPGALKATARPRPGRARPLAGPGWMLSGRSDPVVAAPVSAVAVVHTPEAVFLTELSPLQPPPEPAMDLTQTIGWLDFDATPAVWLGGPEAAARLAERAAVAWSAELLGGAERVLEMASEYAKVRIQFGKPIGSFQAVKHRCADMVVDVEGMRSATWYGAWCIAAGHEDRPLASSMAKIWCSDAARRVMASGLQVHGGIGFTWEHDLHLYLKRSQLGQVSFGDASYHREQLATLLRRRVEGHQSVM